MTDINSMFFMFFCTDLVAIDKTANTDLPNKLTKSMQSGLAAVNVVGIKLMTLCSADVSGKVLHELLHEQYLKHA